MKSITKVTMHSEALELGLFFEHSLDLLCVLDCKANFLRVNDQWEAVLGWERGSLEGISALEIVYPDDIYDAANMFEMACSN
jgi:PAS domain S-box-containing protein